MRTFQDLCTLFGFDSHKPVLVVYNGANLDSFLSAFLLWYERGKSGISDKDIDFFNAERGAVPTNIADKQLLCLGYTYKKQTLLSVLAIAHRVIILDNFVYDLGDLYKYKDVDICNNMYKLISRTSDLTDKSSCMVVWEMLYPDMEPNPVVSHVQDRELFHFKLKNTREVVACLTSHPMEFQVWHGLFYNDIDVIYRDGVVIRRYQAELCKYLVKSATRVSFLQFTGIPTVNCPWFLISEVLMCLAQNDTFAIGYYDKHKKRHVSLRSTVRSGVNVLQLARVYGGGGHTNASGFTVDIRGYDLFGTKSLGTGDTAVWGESEGSTRSF